MLAQKVEMKHMKPEMSVNSVEYVIGENTEDIYLESDSRADNLSSSTSGSDDDDDSPGDSSNSSDFEETPAPRPATVRCSRCGRGPYRSLKLHLFHCVGSRTKFQCVLCKNFFPTERGLQEHHMPLYLCHSCGQVFSNPGKPHFQCLRLGRPSLVLFCSESMPKPCNICKCFFVSEKALSIHVTKIHSSVVSTKVCIVTNPSLLIDKKETSTEIQSGISSPGLPNLAVNGNVCENHASSQPSDVKPRPASPFISSTSPVNQPSDHLPDFSPAGTSSAAPYTVDSEHDYSSPTTVLGLFENRSQQLALMKRMNSGWRSKPPCKCRQCGAIFRQSSLAIIHRYLHRGRRSHRCQCGRAFKRRLHLLRHCVQHAEALKYICVSCGDTFNGAKLLAKHLVGKPLKKSRYGRTIKSRGDNKCRRIPFICDCGQLFLRPSAFIWHQIKNRTKKGKKKIKIHPTVTLT